MTALAAIAAGFAGLKIVEVAANVEKVVKGFQALGWIKKSGGGGGGAGGGGGGTSSGDGFGWMGGLALIGTIAEGFKWAADRRNNQRDQVRGTDEYLMAQSGGAEAALAEFILANKALNEMDLSASENKWNEAFERLDMAKEALFGQEGGQEAFDAYSAWRQEHSYGNEYWELPDSLERMSQEADNLARSTDSSTDASVKLADAAGKLPREVANAVSGAVSGMTVVLDGGGLSAVIGQVLAGGVMNE